MLAAAAVGIVAALAGGAFAASGPSITSGQEVYSPGQTVDLSGSGWQPGETVQLGVNDSEGDTWSWSDTVTADANGSVSDSLTLPSEFVATYTVTATGTASDSASATFYDDSVAIRGPTTATVGDANAYTSAKNGNGCTTSSTDYRWSIDASSTGSARINPASETSASLSFTAPGTVVLDESWNGTTGAGNPCTATGQLSIAVSAPTKAATAISSVIGVGTYGGTASLTANLASGGNNLGGKTISFTLHGAAVCGDTTGVTCPVTDSNGVATLTGVSLSGYDANTYANYVGASFAGDGSYQASSGSGDLFVGKAGSTVSVDCSGTPFTYNGSAQGCTGAWATTSKDGGGGNLTTITYTGRPGTTYGPSTTAPTNAGDYTASATFDGDTNHTGSSNSADFTIDKKAASVSVDDKSKTYGDDNPTLSATVTGTVNGDTLDYSLSTTAGKYSDVGDYTITVILGSNPNYDVTPADGTLSITKASSSTTVICSGSTYDGSPQEDCSASVTGANLDQTLTVSYAGQSPTVYAGPDAPTGAGDYTGSASYGGDRNHNGSSNSASFTIQKANPTCTVTGYKVTLDGNSHTATGSCTGVATDGTLSGLDLSGTTHTDPGSYTDSWSFTDTTGNYNDASGTVDDHINYDLGIGFLPPLNPDDTGTDVNTGNAGRTYPIKWQLTDANNNYVTNAVGGTTIYVAKVSCDDMSGDPIDTTDYASSTGGTAFRYDSTANQYIYNWQTPSTKSTCYRMTINLPSGQQMIAAFQLK